MFFKFNYIIELKDYIRNNLKDSFGNPVIGQYTYETTSIVIKATKRKIVNYLRNKNCHEGALKVWDNETMKQLYLHQNKIQYKDNRIDRIESLARKKQEKMSIAYVKENQVALKIGVPIQYLHPIKTEYYEMFYENTYIDAVLELERTYGIELFKVNDENRIENNDRPLPF